MAGDKKPDSPDVFLCHNKADKDWVRELGTRLEAESIDGTTDGRRIRVFFDEWDIERGENIVARLGEELGSGAFVAVVMSPEFFASDWTRFEWTDVVARDPTNKGGRLIPLRLRDTSLDRTQTLTLPAPFNALRHFDFRSSAGFERELQDLLRRIRNQPLPRGRSVAPRYSSALAQQSSETFNIEAAEVIPEILIGNIAPLTTTPPALYLATAKISSLSELPGNEDVSALTLKLWEGQLVTFADLEDPECALNNVIDPYTIKKYEFHKCALDRELRNSWLALANKCVVKAMRKKQISQDEKGRFYFLPAASGKTRQVAIANAKPREVAAKRSHHTSGEEFWVHYSADVKFRIIGSTPFLRILPSYAFTRDGVESLDRKQSGRFRVIWGGKQDSAAVLRQILFWMRFMSDGHEEWVLETGGTPIRISVMPATAEIQRGISADHIRIKALVDDWSSDELAAIADSALVTDAPKDVQEDSDDGKDTDNQDSGAEA